MRYSLLFAIVFIVVSCSSKKETKEYEHRFENQVWSMIEPVDFIFEVGEEDKDYSIDVYVDINSSYVFSNLMYSITILTPNGGERRMTINVDVLDENKNILAQQIDGGWRLNYAAMRRTAFSTPGDYTIRLSHNMPYNSLEGVKAIGLKIKELQREKKY